MGEGLGSEINIARQSEATDIMYALKKYVDVTGDKEFLYHEGVEMLVETARLWTDLGFYAERMGGRPEGRRYVVSATVTDACGNTSTPAIVGTIFVPHDQRKK